MHKTILRTIILTFLTASLFAHPDDPKYQDLQPPYRGPDFLSGKRAGVDFNSQGVELISWMNLERFGADVFGASDCWGYTSPAGREYAIIALRNKVAFVEITTPSAPIVVGNFSAPVSLWRDVKVYQNYAYSVSEGGGGIQVFDMSNIDQGSVSELASVLDEENGSDETHNVAIDTVSGYLYRTGGGDNGLRIYSLADPTTPTFVTSWELRYVHDAQVKTFTEGPYAGRQVVFACAGFNGGYQNTGLTILDVTDKNNLQELFHYEYPSNTYSHQGWLSEDAQYFFLGDELDERFGTVSQTVTRIIDVSNLSAPSEVGTISNGLNAIDHNMYTKDGLLYQANYRSGLRVFDISDPLNAQEIAYFDTYEDDDEPRFNGLWNAYPYFESGTIIGSDMEKGLFLWRLSETNQNNEFQTQTRLMMPWISNSDTFDSTIVVQNIGDSETEVRFSARRADGSNEITTTYTIPARGFQRTLAADLFPGLGIGAGYAVSVEATTADVVARWVTRDKVSQSPSQGVAIATPLDGSEKDDLKNALEFGYLPNSEGFSSAMVVCHTGAGPSDVTFYWFRADGSLANSETVNQVEPNTPIVQLYDPGDESDLVGVAYSSDAKLAGVVFVFNAEGQTAIGNARGISNYTPPSEQ